MITASFQGISEILREIRENNSAVYYTVDISKFNGQTHETNEGAGVAFIKQEGEGYETRAH